MPGNLGNRATTLKWGCDFHTLEFFFVGMISRLDLVIDLCMFLEICDVFWTSSWGVFWAKCACKWKWKKESEKGVNTKSAVKKM